MADDASTTANAQPAAPPTTTPPLDTAAVSQLRVRFVARQQRYAVTDKPILVPASLKRYGLSEVVNHLLGNADANPVPFDFLIDGAFLRTSLIQYLQENNLSSENLLTLEYVESMLPPSSLSSLKHDDWISSVAGHRTQSLFLSGSYDTVVRVWNAMAECAVVARGHTQPVTSVKWVHDASNDDSTWKFLSAGQDARVLAWEASAEAQVAAVGGGGDQAEAECLYEAVGHTGAVEDIALTGNTAHFATASADASIRVWATAFGEGEEEAEATTLLSGSKRRKTKSEGRPRKSALASLDGHVGKVSSVAYNRSSGALYSGGWDHSVRVWDVEARANIMTKNCEKVVHAIDYSQAAGLIASGHSDHILRLWDPRAQDASILKLSLSAHKNWVSSLSWSPTNPYTLASASYDGSVKVWDIRSRTPLYTLYEPSTEEKKKQPNEEVKKVLAVDWTREFIISGGEAAEVRIHRVASETRTETQQ